MEDKVDKVLGFELPCDDHETMDMCETVKLKAKLVSLVREAVLTELKLLPAWNMCKCDCASCKVIGGRIAQLKSQEKK